ncbi:replication endonuclease [Pectobacterium versatile]|uniref:replication endonuclease n=1 Tax=Pectobacterium versatile TaxID=2488639 RepID=UPI00102F1813|nr:replication endonuclease [Pectobacterium versatile]TAI90447.1 hypothetical protein EG333_02890 [Pectobacterium versatile]
MFSGRLSIADKNFSHYGLGKIYLRDRQGIALQARELAGEFKSLIGGLDINESIDQSFKNIFTKNYFSVDFDESDILVFDEKLNSGLSELHCRRDFFNPKKIHIPEAKDFFENGVFMRVARAVRAYGLEMPKIRGILDFLEIPFSDWPDEIQNIFYGSLARVSASEYWQSILWRIRCHWCGCRDTAKNLVHKRVSPYISARALREFAAAQQRMKIFLENNELESDCDRISLETAYNSGNSCPKNRRTELMVRLRHTAEFFTAEGLAGYFLTITLPSRFHANHADGRENSRCRSIDPREAQTELSRIWRNVGRKFARDEIFFAGFRFVEPHHDGVPHWHVVVWFRPQQADVALKILRDRYCERDFAEISHNPEIRFKSIPIDPERGATAYCAAYVSKNIDGFGLGLDGDFEADLSAVDGATRATAWARLYRIRQFQAFGCVGATAWRELRRVRKTPDCDPILRNFWQAADEGDFGQFIRLSREHGGVSLYRADEDFSGQEIRNCWGEKTSKVRGVSLSADPSTRVQTRTRDWIIVPKQVENQSVSDAVQRCGTAATPWTSGNNCPPSKRAEQGDFGFSIDHAHNNYREAPNAAARLRI